MKQILAISLVLMFCCVSVAFGEDIFFEDFESGDGGLIGSLDWEWGEYAWVGGNCYSDFYPPPTAYSGTKMWATKLNICYSDLGNNDGYDTCTNGNPSDDSILDFTVDLTGYTDATMTFHEWIDVFLNWDWAEVYVNGNVVLQHCGTGFVAPTDWVQQTVDLTPYVGDVAVIEFHLMTSTVVNHAGWYIDDIYIFSGGAAPTPTPTPVVSPTPEPPTATPTSDCINHGDVTLDGTITAGDAQLAFQIALGSVMPTYEEECAADCNGDEMVTAGDAQEIFLAALGSGNCVDPL